MKALTVPVALIAALAFSGTAAAQCIYGTQKQTTAEAPSDEAKTEAPTG